MRVVVKSDLVVLVPETDTETLALAPWTGAECALVFATRPSGDSALELRLLGTRPEACREPINVVSTSPDPMVRLIGNFAPTPFVLDDLAYRSVESFWQGLKFPGERVRREIAELEGPVARSRGAAQPYKLHVTYRGEAIVVGTYAHWRLMERACAAKFAQNREAADALLATGERPLTHRVKRDSRSIPGVVMADIWMRIRARLRDGG